MNNSVFAIGLGSGVRAVLSLSLSLSLCVIDQTCLAQTEEEYADGGGEDSWGPSYQVTEVPTAMTDFLDEDGRWIVPSFINATPWRNGSECWVIEQDPVPGAERVGTQTYNQRIRYTCDGTTSAWARIPITLIDITPPTIDVFLDSNATPHTSFGGVTRYPASAVVVPVIDVSDGADANPAFDELVLDGQPYSLNTPISGVGLHILNALVSDASGNLSSTTTIFEIRERPSHTGGAVVQSTQSDVNGNGQVTHFEATVLFSADEFDHHEVYLPSVRMVLRDGEGNFIAYTPIPIRGGYPIGCDIFQYSAAEVTKNDCYITATFEADFAEPLDSPPAELFLVGAGIANGALSFEWGARTVNVADPNPVQTLGSEFGWIAPCGDPEPPAPPALPPCELVVTEFFPPCCTSTVYLLPTGTCAGEIGIVKAQAEHVTASGRGSSYARAPGLSWPGPPPICNSKISSGCWWNGIVVAQLVGDCCNCAINFNVSASLTARARVASMNASNYPDGNFIASAQARGIVNMFTPCSGYVFVASVATIVNTSDSTLGWVTDGPKQGTVSCTDSNCASFLMIDSISWFSTEAEAYYYNEVVEARLCLMDRRTGR